jgi:hypothetical protein
MVDPDRWQERTLQDGEWLCLRFGGLTLVVLSTLGEWRVAPMTGGQLESLKESAMPPDDLPWQRWDRGRDDVKLQFRPVFPDRPLIIRPRSPLNLSPRAKALFYVGIPAFIELSAHSEGQYERLAAWPSDPPSNTWHGSPIDGKLCYSVKTRARRQFIPEDWQELSIISTIEIANSGSHTMPFERLFLETGHLAVFEHHDRLWANHARIRTGEKDDTLSGMVFSGKPFGEAAGGIELTPPRLGRVRRSMLTQAFSTFLGVTQAND